MNLLTKKLLFFLFWVCFLLVGPITIISATPFSSISGQPVTMINFFQRITGLLLFSLLVVQLTIGSQMEKLTEKLGGWIFRFHIFEGILIYALILLHPLLFVLFNFKIRGVFDPFYVFTDLCVLCKGSSEYFYNFGRIAFWFITIAVFAGSMRTQPWLQKHWRKFHILNYAAFFLVAIHSFKIGTDVKTEPFVWLFYGAIVWVILLVVLRIYKYLRK